MDSSSPVNLHSRQSCTLPPGGHAEIWSKIYNGTRPRRHAWKRHAGKSNPFKIQAKMLKRHNFQNKGLNRVASSQQP